MAESPAFALPTSSAAAPEFVAMSAARLLVIGGIVLIVAGLIFGDIFAVFILHQNANRIGERLLAATEAVAAGNPQPVAAEFAAIGDYLENRGTKVDTHVHIIDFGYLALLLALLQPYVSLHESRKRRLAALFLTGAVLLPVGVFLIHHLGLKYSPLSSIGWASIFADLGGLFVLLASGGMAAGLWRNASDQRPQDHVFLQDRSWSGRALLAGGAVLILAGFLHGGWYSWRDLYRLEAQESVLLNNVVESSAANHAPQTKATLDDYAMLQAEKAVKIAAHSHLIEFGLLAMLLAFIQPYVYLREQWRRRWAVVLLAGSVVLPVFVSMELDWGLVAGGIADFGGLLVIIALMGMLAGVLRYSGRLDSLRGGAQ